MTKIYNPIISILTITVVIYIAVDAFYRVVRVGVGQSFNSNIAMLDSPDVKSVTRARLDDFQIIMDRNIFGSIGEIPIGIEKKEVETLTPTKLRISLLGTVAGDKDNAVAVIEDTGRRTQMLYRVGDSIQNAVVRTILRGKVVLNVDGQDEILMMPEPSSSESWSSKTPEYTKNALVPRVVERSITVRQKDFEESFDNIEDLFAQTQMRPHLKDGIIDGLTITGIRAGSIFRRMGLRNGDIILTVSGNPVSEPNEILKMYNELKAGSNISLQIERRDLKRSLNYNIR